VEGIPHAKCQPIRPVVSEQYWLVTDRQTDGHMTTAYTALAASRGKNQRRTANGVVDQTIATPVTR